MNFKGLKNGYCNKVETFLNTKRSDTYFIYLMKTSFYLTHQTDSEIPEINMSVTEIISSTKTNPYIKLSKEELDIFNSILL